MRIGEIVDTSKLVKLGQADALSNRIEYRTFHRYRVRPSFVKLFEGQYVVTGRKKNETEEYLVEIFTDHDVCCDELRKIVRKI